MAFIQFSKVSLAFGDRDILKDVSVNLATGTKAALTGANGAGKSTLIKIMAGLVEPDSGERVAQKDARIAYLPQSGLVHSGCTLKEEADKAFEWGYEIQRKADELQSIVIHSLAPGNGFSIYLDCEAIRPAAIFQLEYSSIASVCHFNSS